MKIAFPKLFLAVLCGSLLVSCGLSPTRLATTFPNTPERQITASQEDLDAIQQVALDYIEGWYEGNAERMERSLHPELVKRVILPDQIVTLSKKDMVEMTQSGSGKSFSGAKENTVTILDVFYEIATVKVESAEFIDYLHIGKVGGEWMIINVLWTGKRDTEPGK